MDINIEFELNRRWIIDEATGEEIGETNFVVPMRWMKNLFDKSYADKYDCLDAFMEVYTPEIDGEFIYREAIKDGALIEDIGVTMY